MSNESLEKLANYIIGAFFKGMVTPQTLLDLLRSLAGEAGKQLGPAIEEAWARGNKARVAAGKEPIDPAKPLLYSRGFGEAVDAEEYRHYLPEEKIIINQDIFRNKLAKVDFSSLDATRERALVEELRQESIGLTKDDTLLYLNLIKVDFLARKGGAAAAKSQESPIDTAARIIRLVERQFLLDQDSFARLNAGKRPDMDRLTELVAVNVKTQRLSPRLLLPYLEGDSKFIEKFKDFLRLVVQQRDGNLAEVTQNFGVYLLLNGTPPDQLASLGLSPPLEAFVSDRIGRVRPIYYTAMLFGYSLSMVLFAQTFELSAKYREMPDDQKAKLRKLYESRGCRELLVSSAVTVATRRVGEFVVEAREMQLLLKTFLAANKRLVTIADIFPEAKS